MRPLAFLDTVGYAGLNVIIQDDSAYLADSRPERCNPDDDALTIRLGFDHLLGKALSSSADTGALLDLANRWRTSLEQDLIQDVSFGHVLAIADGDWVLSLLEPYADFDIFLGEMTSGITAKVDEAAIWRTARGVIGTTDLRHEVLMNQAAHRDVLYLLTVEPASEADLRILFAARGTTIDAGHLCHLLHARLDP